jgi:hypothetical protein
LRRKLRQLGEGVPAPYHILGDSRLADFDPELEQLAVDPGRAPARIGAADLTNQLANFVIH